MPKGIAELKRRNGASRERYHAKQIAQAFAQSLKTSEIKKLYRRDLKTGAITESSRSKMEFEIWWSETFSRWNNYSSPASVAWEELNKGAMLHTKEAVYWLETTVAAQKAA